VFEWLRSELDTEAGKAENPIFQISLYGNLFFNQTSSLIKLTCGCTNAFYSHKESSRTISQRGRGRPRSLFFDERAAMQQVKVGMQKGLVGIHFLLYLSSAARCAVILLLLCCDVSKCTIGTWP